MWTNIPGHLFFELLPQIDEVFDYKTHGHDVLSRKQFVIDDAFLVPQNLQYCLACMRLAFAQGVARLSGLSHSFICLKLM